MSLSNLLRKEIAAIFHNSVILLTVFGGVIFYSFLYPFPYEKQVPREQKITVVNLDNSLTSRQLERMVDATPQISIVRRAHSIREAKKQFVSGEVSGILVIPEHFYRDLQQNKSPVLSYSGDGAYFLIYGTIAEGLLQASETLGAKVKISRLLMDGEPLSMAEEDYAHIKVNMRPVFNPAIGYVYYVVPAVFVLILQQTLIIGAGLSVGTERSQKDGYWKSVSTYKILLVRVMLFAAIYYVLSMYYFGFSFDHHNIIQVASCSKILMILTPFLVTSIFIGICLGTVLPRREIVTAVVLVSSMPLIFSVGFVWPLEAMPKPIIWVTNLFPCTPAIQSFLSVNQLGAGFSQILPQWKLLWLQVICWGLLAFFSYRRLQKTASA